MSLPSFFNKMLKDSNASIAVDEENSGVVRNWIDSGCYVFNALLSGDIYKGFPGNKIIGIGGASSVGKTFFVLSAVKAFLEDNPTGYVVYYDTESTISKSFLESRGIDPSRVIVVEPIDLDAFKIHITQFLNEVTNTPVKERVPIMIALDSLGNIPSAKEFNDAKEGKSVVDMSRAKSIKSIFRIVTVQLGLLDIPMFVTAHVYSDMGLFPKDIVSGGTGLVYTSSTLIGLGKAQEKDGNEIVGSIIRCKAMKSRLSKENTVVRVLLRYDTGLQKYYGLLELAEAAGIFKKVSTRYDINGKMVFGKTINENPEEYFTKDVLDQINEYVHQAFTYGSSAKEFNLSKILGEEKEEQVLLNEEENA